MAGKGVGVQVTNVDDVMKFFDVKKKVAVQAFEEGLFEVANTVFTMSQREVPVDTGTLKASGTIERKGAGIGDKMEIVIYYGGAASEYAIHVHENPNASHAPPTKFKFLEGPFLLMKPRIPMLLAKKIRARLK